MNIIKKAVKKANLEILLCYPLHYCPKASRIRTYPSRITNEVTKLYASALLFIYVQKTQHVVHSTPPNMGLNSTFPFLGQVHIPVSGS